MSLKAGLYTFISGHLKKIIEIGFPELEKRFLQRFRSFSVKWLLKYLSLAVPNSSRIEHLSHIIPKTQIWLVVNLPVFMFVYIHFNVPPTRIADLVRNLSDEKIYYWYGTVTFVNFSFLLLSTWFVFSHLCYTANEYSIYHFCVMIKDFSISFSRVIIVQGFETVIFYVIFGCKPTCVISCWIKRVRVSSQFNSVFFPYISTAIPSSLVRGYIEVKIDKHEIW